MEDPVKTLAELENLRARMRDLREAFEKGPPTREIAKELELPPPPHDDASVIDMAAWFERMATHAVVNLSKELGVEPIGVHRDRPVRRNRKPPPGG